MRGAGLRRYIPDPQTGNGFVWDVAKGVAGGVKRGFPNPKASIVEGYRGGKRVVKRKAAKYVHGKAKRALNDLFGP